MHFLTHKDTYKRSHTHARTRAPTPIFTHHTVRDNHVDNVADDGHEECTSLFFVFFLGGGVGFCLFVCLFVYGFFLLLLLFCFCFVLFCVLFWVLVFFLGGGGFGFVLFCVCLGFFFFVFCFCFSPAISLGFTTFG